MTFDCEDRGEDDEKLTDLMFCCDGSWKMMSFCCLNSILGSCSSTETAEML